MTHRPAKFTVPRQRGVMARPRLLESIPAGPRAPAVWIEGAPGAGKTTLAASHLLARASPCLWFRVDSADNDLAELFAALSTAAEDASKRRARLPVFAADHLAGALVFARRYFRAFYTRLAADCCLVFDNVHELDPGTPLQVLSIAIEEAPAGVQLLLLSRGAPTAEFAALAAARQLARLDPQALAFTRDELQALLPKHKADVVTAIHGLTQGWPAGIVLAARCWPAQRLPAGDHGADDARADSKEAVFRFFAHEVLGKMPPHEQRVLQLAALLPDMRADRADALTGQAESARILEAAYRRNLFTTYRRGAPGTYQFHALFREYLLEQARLHIPAAELAAARRRACELMLADGDVVPALDMMVGAQDWPAASRALADSAPLLLRQGRHATLWRWLQALPAATTQQDPWLLYWMADARGRTDEMAACAWYEQAWTRFDGHREQALGQALCAASAILAIDTAGETYQDLARWSSRLREALGAPAAPRHAADELLLASAIAASACLNVPVLPDQETVASIERVLSLMEKDRLAPDADLVRAGAAVLGFCDLQRNEQLFARILGLVEPRLREPGVSPLTRCRWLMQASLCHLTFVPSTRPERVLQLSRAALREAREIAERERLVELEFNLIGVEVRHAVEAHDQQRYDQLVFQASGVLDVARPVEIAGHFMALSAVHLARGEIEQALHASERGQVASRAAATPPMYELASALVHGFALIACAREDDAIALLSALADDLSERHRLVAEAFVGLTRAWQCRDQPARYAVLLQEGMGLAAACRWTLFFRSLPEVAVRLCADALAHDIEPAFVRECIERRRLSPPPDADEGWPWPIRVRVLGSFELRLIDNEAPLGAKTPRRQVELLQAIALSGAGGLGAWQAAEWLWPAGESGKNPLDVTLHRLRKLLGEPQAIQLQEGRLVFDPALVWSDVAQFESLSAALLGDDLRSASDAALQKHARRALALYRGPLLSGARQSAWVVNVREQLQARFERVVQALGGQLEQRAMWPVALDLYTRALEQDDLAEAAYRGQIRCHLALAQPVEALSAFRRCRHRLSVMLGVAPAPQTLALVGSLQGQA